MQSLHSPLLIEFLQTASKPLVVILGPTASGKTGMSITLAQAIGTAEIINADSRQLYKFLDIGTAKITREEMQGVPHHLLDVLDPKEEVTAAWYKREAEKIIDQIHEKGRVPMLVGGSMLYISAVIDGLDFSGPGDPRQSKVACPYDLFIIGIERPRGEITRRVDERTAELFQKGWMEEVRSLIKRGYRPGDPGMKSHGYKEIMEWLCHPEVPPKATSKGDVMVRGAATAHLTMTELQEAISSKTRQYAKRQMTWWRQDKRIHWLGGHSV